MHLEAEGPTIQITEQERNADPSTLSFEQLYHVRYFGTINLNCEGTGVFSEHLKNMVCP